MPHSSPVYEKRLTFFVDFLAFKEHVDRTVTEPDFLGKLLGAMDRVGELVADDDLIRKSQRVTQFSDCMVVSYRVDEESAVFWLLNAIALCVIDLAERGFLLRGAVTYGDLFHTDRHVVGPALVKAYQLESKVAFYPRILIDKELVDLAKVAHADIHNAEDEEEYVRDFMTKDDDGNLFFDYFTARSVVDIVGGELEFYPEYLRKLSVLAQKGLAHGDHRVAKKYLWFYRKYLDAVDRVLSLPANHPGRTENPEIMMDMEALPRFDAEAEAAAIRVATGEAEKAKNSA